MGHAEEGVPQGFSGLLYPPNGENGVYLLMGLLWDHLPYPIVFDCFELPPVDFGDGCVKQFDASGHVLVDGVWKHGNIEFKQRSSDWLTEVEKKPGLHVEYLVCWDDDSQEAHEYVDHAVISLKAVLHRLPEEQRRRIVLRETRPPVAHEKQDVAALIDGFASEIQPKVRYLVDSWCGEHGRCHHVACGEETEIVLSTHVSTRKHKVARLRAFGTQHLIVWRPSLDPLGVDEAELLADSFSMRISKGDNPMTLTKPLKDVDYDWIDRLVKKLQQHCHEGNC